MLAEGTLICVDADTGQAIGAVGLGAATVVMGPDMELMESLESN